MRPGHSEAQVMFEKIGVALGHETRRSWSISAPTDGVWLTKTEIAELGELPIAAIEVIVSESPKSIRGSALTLAEVSPAVGILLIHEQEIRRGLLRAGKDVAFASQVIDGMFKHALTASQRCFQRLEVWSFSTLQRRFHMLYGTKRPLIAA